MQNGRIASVLLMMAVFSVSTLHAQTGPQAGTGQAIPDLSGIWEAPNAEAR